MLVQLENLGSHSLRWRLEIEGDFPLNWCLWQQEAAEEIAPNQKVDRSLFFQIPEDFFENQYALDRGRDRLKINYATQVYVYAEAQTERQLVAYRVFNLCVRPSSSYLNFVPAIYREIDFMGRFLTIFEQAFDPAVQTIDVLWAYLDPLTAPESLLPFLANWVAWPIDRRWDIKQQRRLIRNAVELYHWHGTRRGLRYYLHLYTELPLDEDLPESEKHIRIEDVFARGFVMGQTLIGEDSMLGGGRPFHFIVRLRPEPDKQIDEELVKNIIEREKPAFCTYELSIDRGVRPRSG
jgi:phage tail-like protein